MLVYLGSGFVLTHTPFFLLPHPFSPLVCDHAATGLFVGFICNNKNPSAVLPFSLYAYGQVAFHLLSRSLCFCFLVVCVHLGVWVRVGDASLLSPRIACSYSWAWVCGIVMQTLYLSFPLMQYVTMFVWVHVTQLPPPLSPHTVCGHVVHFQL